MVKGQKNPPLTEVVLKTQHFLQIAVAKYFFLLFHILIFTLLLDLLEKQPNLN
jgi:hypothetical protein